MKHRIRGRKFGRHTSARKALLKNLTVSVLKHEQIKTTLHKAKEVRPLVEKMITLGKAGNLHARRQAYAYIPEKSVVDKLFGVLAERYQDRSGGYSRVVRAGYRSGDAADLGIIELVDRDVSAKGTDSGKTLDNDDGEEAQAS